MEGPISGRYGSQRLEGGPAGGGGVNDSLRFWDFDRF